MSATPASGAAPEGGMMAILVNFAPFIIVFVLFYFLLIRPQQRRAKAHQAAVSGIKRGDTVVLSNGMIGKVSTFAGAPTCCSRSISTSCGSSGCPTWPMRSIRP